MSVVLGIAKLGFKSRLVYRLGAFLTALSALAVVAVFRAAWSAAYADHSVLNGYTAAEAVAYTLVAIVLTSTAVIGADWIIHEGVNTGALAMLLVLPISLYRNLRAEVVGRVAANFLLVFVPTVAGAGFLFGLPRPPILNLLAFVPAWGMAVLIFFNVEFLVGLMSVRLESALGLISVKNGVVALLAGGAIPLEFYPGRSGQLLEWSPFAAMLYAPARILSSDIDVFEVCLLLSRQVAWLGVMALLVPRAWRRVRPTLRISGG